MGDPTAPKRAMSGYFTFSQEVREKIQKGNHDLKMCGVQKKISELWNAVLGVTRFPRPADFRRTPFLEQLLCLSAAVPLPGRPARPLPSASFQASKPMGDVQNRR